MTISRALGSCPGLLPKRYAAGGWTARGRRHVRFGVIAASLMREPSSEVVDVMFRPQRLLRP